MADYTRQINTAQRMIRDKGRMITAITFTPADAGSMEGMGVETEAELPAVFVNPGGTQFLGLTAQMVDGFKVSEQVAIIAHKDGLDLKDATLIREKDGSEWHVDKVDELKPAEQTILYYIGVSRP